MGLFSGKKTTHIASSVWNMAGDADGRVDYMKSTVVGSVLREGSEKRSLGETIVNAHLNGPGIQQRRFFSWAQDNYSLGMPTTTLKSSFQVDPDDVENEVPQPVDPDLSVIVTQAFVENADYSYFAEKHIYENHPELIGTNWIADLDLVNEQIIIQYEDTTTELVDISSTGYSEDKDYLVAYFKYKKADYEGDVVEGTLVEDLPDDTTLPDTTGYTQTEDEITATTTTDLHEIVDDVITYSDARPDETETTDTVLSTETHDDLWQEYQRETYQGNDDTNQRQVTLREFINHYEYSVVVETVVTETIVEEDTPDPGVTKTTERTTTTQTLERRWGYREDTQELYSNEIVGGDQMFIYEMGSGNTVLDALEEEKDASNLQEFFPFVPVWISNDPASDYDFYEEAKKAYKRGTDGGNLDDLVESIADNDDVDDMDHVFMTYGISFNVRDNSARKYLYEFYKMLMSYQDVTATEYDQMLTDRNLYESRMATWKTWYAAQSNPGDPLYQTPEPIYPKQALPSFTTIRIKSNDTRVRYYDIRLSWVTIQEEIFSGLGKAGARKGDVWCTTGTTDDFNEYLGAVEENGDHRELRISKVRTTYIWKQVDGNTYTRLMIKGAVHQNYVYDGRAVVTHANEALEDFEESPFLVPIHYPTLRKLSLVDSTQLVTANTFLVVNSYQVVKQKWWQTGFFKVLLVIAVAIATVYFAPAGTITGGILGTNVAVGGAIGLTGTAALLAGAAINAIAAMLLVQVIEQAAIRVFGEKWGGVVAAIVGFIAVQGLTNMATSGQLGMNWGSMMRADNLLQLTNVGANAYAGWVRGSIGEMQQESLENQEEYEQQSGEIADLMSELGMGNRAFIDPVALFTEIREAPQAFIESPSAFINRTTMVGSDLIDLSLSMISDYAEMNLTLPSGPGSFE